MQCGPIGWRILFFWSGSGRLVEHGGAARNASFAGSAGIIRHTMLRDDDARHAIENDGVSRHRNTLCVKIRWQKESKV